MMRTLATRFSRLQSVRSLVVDSYASQLGGVEGAGCPSVAALQTGLHRFSNDTVPGVFGVNNTPQVRLNPLLAPEMTFETSHTHVSMIKV
jgi:hypothetical protein